MYDAEHFFDGYLDDADYAIRTLEAAARGARPTSAYARRTGESSCPRSRE